MHEFRRLVEALESRRLLAAGDLDLAFGGGDGVATLSTGVGSQIDRGQFVGVDADGRIVVVGTTSADRNFGTARDILVSRFTPGGAIDTTFGPGGRGWVTASATNADTPVDLAVQPDGRILVAFRNPAPAAWGVMRFNADGTMDSSFGGGDGVVAYDFGGYTETITKMALQPDGKIFTVGSIGGSGWLYASTARLLADGSLDTSFSYDGWGWYTPDPTGLQEFVDVTVDGSSVAVLGTLRPPGTGTFNRTFAMRLNSAGGYDTTFGPGGYATISIPNQHVDPHSIVVDPATSRVSVAATIAPTTDLVPLPLNLFRFAANGTLDATFNPSGATPGRLEVPQATLFRVDPGELLVQPDGKLVFGGAYSDATGNAFQLVRVSSDGTLDASFSGDGLAKFTPTSPRPSVGTDLAIDSSGGLVLSGLDVPNGTTDYDLAAIRVESGLPLPSNVTLTAGGALTIRGTEQPDTFMVRRSGSQMLVNAEPFLLSFPAASVTSLDVELYGGNDLISLSGVPGGRVDFGGGLKNTLTLGGGNVAGGRLDVMGGAGNDRVTITDTASNYTVSLDGGVDQSATDWLDYAGTAAADTFRITDGRIDRGAGTTVALNTAVSTIGVSGGDGADTFDVSSTSFADYALSGGAGDDTYLIVNGAGNTLKSAVRTFGDAGTDSVTYDDSIGGIGGITIDLDFGGGGGVSEWRSVENFTYYSGPGGSASYVYAGGGVHLVYYGGGPDTTPGDRLQLDPNLNITSHVRTSLQDGKLYFGGSSTPMIEYYGFERLPTKLDTAAPTVTASAFDVNKPEVRYTFSEDVSLSVDLADLTLTNFTTGATIPGNALVLNKQAGPTTPTVARWTTFANQRLPDGNYRATLPAASVYDYAEKSLAAAATVDFFVLAGDANRDRHVDSADLAILSANLGQSNKTFVQGDFNYDGAVNQADRDILDANWLKWLPEQGTAATLAATAGDDAHELRLEDSSIVAVYDGTGAAATLAYRVPVGALGGMSYGGGGGVDRLGLVGLAGDVDTVNVGATSISFAGLTLAHSQLESVTFDGRGGQGLAGGTWDSVTVRDGMTLTLPATQQLQYLTVAAGSTVRVTPGAGATLAARSLDLLGKLDLADNRMVVYRNGSDAAGVAAMVASGRAGGAGITSSVATGSLTTLGVSPASAVLEISGAQTGMWGGQTVALDDVLVKFTYAGDADLNGKLDGDDYFILDSHVLAAPGSPGSSEWWNGDVDYSGNTNGDDYFLLDSNLSRQGVVL